MSEGNSLSDQIREKIRLPVSKAEFRVFVFGPGMNPSDIVDVPVSDVTSQAGLVDFGKYLRFYTAQKLRADGWTVDFGETESISKFWASLGIKNAAAMEISHARKLCGAIVIFPASIGAICELGLFANSPQLAEKAVAIVHSEFKNHQSFFTRGLLKLFKMRHGTVEFEDYRDFEACLRQAVEFVESEWTNLDLDELAIADSKILTLKREGTSFEKNT